LTCSSSTALTYEHDCGLTDRVPARLSDGPGGIVSKRMGSLYRSGRSPDPLARLPETQSVRLRLARPHWTRISKRQRQRRRCNRVSNDPGTDSGWLAPSAAVRLS
jgi:hypothetical protein